MTSSWGAWKAAHPNTTIVAPGGGLGRRYPADPLRGRDDNGPIFPVGDVDPRLPVQEQVVGVIAPDGTPLAFPAVASRAALQAGKDVELAGVHLELHGDGLRAVLEPRGACGQPPSVRVRVEPVPPPQYRPLDTPRLTRAATGGTRSAQEHAGRASLCGCRVGTVASAPP